MIAHPPSPFGRRRFPSVRATLRMVRLQRTPGDRLQRRLASALTIADLRTQARRRVPLPIFDFIDGGAGDETTLRRNEESFRRVTFVPRVLRDVGAVDTSTTLLGTDVALPIVLAPVGMTRMAHRDGEVAAARAAARAGIPYCLSTMASSSPETVSTHAPSGPKWFQLYVWRDRAASEALVRRAEAAGFDTLVVTADVAVAGDRLRDQRHGLALPPSLPPRTVLQILRRPRWWMDAIMFDPLDFAAIRTDSADFVSQTNAILDPAMTLADLEWLRGIWSGRILVKGVLDRADAAAVVGAGADGVIVSNHGGRQLENAVSPLDVLGEIREELGAEPAILVDGGVRSGAHVAAAVAAGADAVLIGRAYLYGLMAGGEAGVDRSLDLLAGGLRRTMALLGAASVDDLLPAMVRR